MNCIEFKINIFDKVFMKFEYIKYKIITKYLWSNDFHVAIVEIQTSSVSPTGMIKASDDEQYENLTSLVTQPSIVNNPVGKHSVVWVWGVSKQTRKHISCAVLSGTNNGNQWYLQYFRYCSWRSSLTIAATESILVFGIVQWFVILTHLSLKLIIFLH